MKNTLLNILTQLYEESKRPFHLLNAIETVSEQETNIFKKLEGILTETQKSREEWRNSIDTTVYEKAKLSDEHFEDKLYYSLIQALKTNFMKFIQGMDKTELEELLDMRYLTELAELLQALTVRVLKQGCPNRKHEARAMNQIWELTDATMKKACFYWKRWRYTVNNILENLPLDKILTHLHEDNFTDMDEVIKSYLPDAVTSLLFHSDDIDSFILKRFGVIVNGISIMPFTDKIVCASLDYLGKGCLINADKPVEEQLKTIFTELYFHVYPIVDAQPQVNPSRQF